MTHTASIRVFPNAVTGRISPYLTGACIEDVNHEIYGGIYSQMLFGESFEEGPLEIDVARKPAYAGLSGTVSCRAERTYLAHAPDIRSWQPFRRGTAAGSFGHTILRSRRGRYSQKIEFLRGQGEVGIENQGLNRWGLRLVANQPYEGTIVALAEADLEVVVALESSDGSRVYAEAILNVPGDKEWHDLAFLLAPGDDEPAGRFAIKLRGPGAVWVDYAFLQPGPWGRFEGLPVRRDIGDALVAEMLTVLRYGGYMVNTNWQHEQRCPGSGYRWKKMVGARQDRPPYLGTFYPYNSNGFGIIEFVAFCEAAGFLCIPAISPSESPSDVADLVEYLNGDTTTGWGRRRADDGHPQPYCLRYLQIGNEELHTSGDGRRIIRPDYPDRFRALADAVYARDPDMTLIMSPWLHREEELGHEENRGAVHRLLKAARERETLWDIHIRGDGLRDADMVERFVPQLRAYLDGVEPQNQVRFCILEENGVHHDLQRALGHAHNINTVERLAGEVVIDCAANCLQPWQQNDNFWDQGQLFFTPSAVWGMPPYYVQQMIARHYQPLCIRAEVDSVDDVLDVTATRSEDGRNLVLKVINLEDAAMPAVVDLVGLGACPQRVRVTCLQGQLDGVNSLDQPRRIAPVESERPWGKLPVHVFPPYSFTGLRFEVTG